MKNIVIFLFIISKTAESQSQSLSGFEIVRTFIENTDSNITRVRTPAERERRWREFAVLDFIGLVEQYDGYTAEEYDVQTEDGYILKLHRISGSPSSPKADGKPAVYVGHGLFVSSDVSVVFGPDHALAFLLADNGYDVWIGNFRGNTYSKRHVKYSTSSNNYDFWNFSLDEMSLIDLPLFIDTVLEKTNQKKLIYIGYSMGTTLSYILLSSKPEYNDKMNLVFNIVPAAIFSRPLSPLLNMAIALAPTIKSFAVANRMYEILPQSKLSQILGKDICNTKRGALVCESILKFVGHIDRVNSSVYPLVFAHVPAGVSLNTLDHYRQIISSGKFRRYDFGATINKAKYNSASPPEFNLTKITSPQAIVYSENDIFGSARDTRTLAKKFPNLVLFEKGPDNFNHLDFLIHIDARKLMYFKALDVLAQYSQI